LTGAERSASGTLQIAAAVLVLLAVAVTAPPTSAQAPVPAPLSSGHGEDTVARPVPVEAAADDAAIASRIQRILVSTGWFQSPDVRVRDGVVFMDGQTETQEHWRWASALAVNTEGAVAVVNRLQVEADIDSTFGRAGDEFVKMYRQAVQAWPWAVLAVAIILITWLLARLVAFLARRFFSSRVSSSLLLSVVVHVFSIPVFLLGMYVVLQVAGLTRLAITVLGGTGIVGIIVGFAFRDIAENFLASILLSMRNPFRTGDLIEVDGNVGIVQNLNIRSTVLLTLDGNYVQIPNAIVFKSTIRNYSSTSSRRADFAVGISYDSSTTKAQSLVSQVLKQHPAVLDTPEPLVLVEQLGSATVDLRVYYWFASAAYSPAKINSALLRLTKDALMKGGIELPDSAREVVFPKGVPIIREKNVERPTSPATTSDQAQVDEEGTSATLGEGDLRNEAGVVCAQSEGKAPEAEENLLKR